jgi:hypothetical protein
MAGSAVAPTEASIAAAAQAAKNQIKESDEKSTEYKAALRKLQNEADNENDTPNTVTIQWTQASVSACVLAQVTATGPIYPVFWCTRQGDNTLLGSLHESTL